MSKLENAVFVKMEEGENPNKTYLCHIGEISPEDKLILVLTHKENDLYGCPCLVETRRGISKGYIVSNILKMSPNKMKKLAENLGGYYPLAPVKTVVYEHKHNDEVGDNIENIFREFIKK